MYVPCVALDEDKAKLMGVELSDLVNKCLVLKSKVSTSGFFVGRETEKKNKKDVQDLLDSILKVAYPYISQVRMCKVEVIFQSLNSSGLWLDKKDNQVRVL